jgi:hypothetical protein
MVANVGRSAILSAFGLLQAERSVRSHLGRINVAPLNIVPGAVVSLMERSNVETVIVAGKVLKWNGQLLGVDLRRLRRQPERARDYLFDAAGIEQDLFRLN